MTKFYASTLIFLLTLFILQPPSYLSADEILLPKEESSAAFLEAEQDSEDVSLFLAGSWKANLSAASGFGWSTTSGFDTSLSYPGIAGGLSFSQSPDITVSLLILNHYIFEAAFTDDFEDSTFMLGYRGFEGEFVQSISAGNMGINISDQIDSSDYFRIPGGGSSSFGIHAALSGPFSDHELLFRFDPQEEQRKIYIGSDSVLEIELEVHDYLKGRFFYIPTAPSDANFYIENESAQAAFTTDGGRSYKQIAASDYSYSPSDGLLVLNAENKTSILVQSASTDWTVASSDAVTVATPEGSMLSLYEPGVFSPFESAAAYSLNTTLPEDSWKTRVYLASDAASTEGGMELSVDLIQDDGIVIIKPSVGGSVLYPLEGIIVNHETVYGMNSLPAGYIIDKKLIFRIREESTSYSVDDPVSGTIRVLVNNIENFNWTESGGTISFDTEPGTEDRIEIIYRKNTGGSTGGDLLFASGNTFDPGGGWTADLNAGLRLNLSGSYSLPGEETSAYGGIAAGISYDSRKKELENNKIILRGDITTGLKLLTENAAGTLLLKDMSEGSLDVVLNRNTVFPAATSASITPELEESKRGLLLYKDYRLNTGISTYILQNYNSTNLADDMIFSPDESTAADRFIAGPYTASAAHEDRSGEILVMDYVLPEEKSWTAVQIPIASGVTNLDLSDYNTLSFDCKAEGSLTDITLYLEVGSLSEDLDGDGILDAETSEFSAGYIFDDPNAEGGTLIGGDNLKGNNGKTDSEDVNSNGFLDAEKTDASAIFEITTKPDSDWKRLSFSFTDTSISSKTSRSRLKNAEFIRITAVNTATSEQIGRILFDDFSFEGASMFASDEDEYSPPEFSEVLESLLPTDEKPETALSSPTIEAGNSNNLMKIQWNDGKNWKLHSYISLVSADEYGSIIFFFMAPALTPAGANPMMLSFNLVDSANKGIRASIPLTAGRAWQKVEIRPKTGEVLINGELSSIAELKVDPEASNLNLIEIEALETTAGILLIDEIQLTNPRLHAVTGLSANIEVDFSEPLLKAGETEIIGPLSIKAAGSADINTDVDEIAGGLFQAAAESGSLSANGSFETNILSAPVSADISWISGGSIAAGHRVSLPFFDSSLILNDLFNTNDASGDSFSKSNSLLLNTDIISGIIAGFSASLDSALLVRKWNSELNTGLDPFSLGLSADFLLSDKNHQFGWSNYFTGWYESTILAADFSTAELQQRRAVLSISPTLSTRPLGFSSSLILSSDIDNEANTKNTADIDLSLPLIFETDFDLVTASLGYSRTGSFTYSGNTADFGGDLSAMFRTISTRSYLYKSIPFYELFDSSLTQTVYTDCEAALIDECSLNNSFTASISRNYSSRLLDLLLPYSIDFSLGRDIKKDFNEIEDELSLDFIWRSAALNLFGAAGVYPIFNFYFSDELNWSVEALIDNPFSAEAVQEYIIKSGCSFFGHDDDIFSINNSIYLPVNLEDKTSTLKSGLMYVWNQHPETPIDLPLFTTEDEEFQLITHEEKLSLNFEEVFSSEFRHTTSLILPQRFTLSAFALAGFEFNNLSDNKTALFGLSFGISGSIIY